VWFGSGEAGVGGIDVVGGAEDGDFGHQRGPPVEQRPRPRGCAAVFPTAGGVADLVGQFGDQLCALVQVWAPLRVGV
jgi:hypothetical protein